MVLEKKCYQLSPNSLNLFLECPHCFWLEKNLGIKRPAPYPYSLNSAVDALLKEEFDNYRAQGIPHPLLVEFNIKARLFPNQQLLNQWRSNFCGLRFFDEELNAILFGALDDVLEFEDKKLAPLDYKSTGSPSAAIYDRFQLQLDTYTFLLEKNGFQTPRRGYLAFYIVDRSRGFVDRLPFRKEILEVETNPSEIYDIFKEAVNCLRSSIPPHHSSDCEYGKWLEGVRAFSL